MKNKYELKKHALEKMMEMLSMEEDPDLKKFKKKKGEKEAEVSILEIALEPMGQKEAEEEEV